MSDSDDLSEIKQRWLGLDADKKDFQLALLAVKLVGNVLEIVPANVHASSKWAMSQRFLADTSAVSLLRISGGMTLVAASFAAALFFTNLNWIGLVVGCIVIFYLLQKIQRRLSRSAIVKGVSESPFVFMQLWELDAFALGVQGKVYEPIGENNRWQDVVLLALGWDDLVETQPRTRLEVMNAIFDQLGSPKTGH